MELCENKTVQGFVTASSITDIFYFVRKSTHSIETAYKCLGALFDIVKVLPVTNDNVISAYAVKAHDFEDCLLAVCAKSNGCHTLLQEMKAILKTLIYPLFLPIKLKLF